jgi:hypothetical protein
MLQEYYKYPRTYHFQFSENLQNDDRMQQSLSALVKYFSSIVTSLDVIEQVKPQKAIKPKEPNADGFKFIDIR